MRLKPGSVTAIVPPQHQTFVAGRIAAHQESGNEQEGRAERVGEINA